MKIYYIHGGLSVGTPSTLYTYSQLWQLFGIGSDIISWSDLFTDAINYGQHGFKMYSTFDYLFSQIQRHRQKMGADRVEYLVKCSCLEIKIC